MKNCKIVTPALLLMLLLLSTAGPATAREYEESKTFDGIETIRINTVSGDCLLQKGGGSQVEVKVVWDYRPVDSYEPVIRERGSVLKLDEDMYGSNNGRSLWTITVPDGVEVRFSTASGDLEAADLEFELTVETASGDIELQDCKGILDISTASGDIEALGCSGLISLSTASGEIDLNDCHGEFDVSTASGTVRADGVVVEDISEFSTASGRVSVSLGESAAYDLRVSTASGRATLDYAGNPMKGYFEFSSKERSGSIRAPFDFDGEERYRRWGDRYIRKWVTLDSDSPQIFVGTASGRAELVK